MSSEPSTRQTPLYPIHARCGAKLVPFAGWKMPVRYSGLIDEHLTVRRSVGLFDVSHMGEIELRGPGAATFCNELTVNDAAALEIGQVQYSAFCYPNGGIVDDVTIYRMAEDHFMICVNAANTEKDFTWVCENLHGDVEAVDASDAYAQLALQGPEAEGTLARCAELDVEAIGYYRFGKGAVGGVPAIVSRTGYTGEDGFEIYLDPSGAEAVWTALIEAGAQFGIKPVGLGARDTLRLEMKYALYGNDIDGTTTPLEAGLGWIVKLAKPSFIGKETLEDQKAQGVKRRLVAFQMSGRGIPRRGYEIVADGKAVGHVTSGTMSPSLKIPIGLGYVNLPYNKVGSAIDIVIRSNPVAAEIVKPPFVPSRVKR